MSTKKVGKELYFEDRDSIALSLLERLKEMGYHLDDVDSDEFMYHFEDLIDPYTEGTHRNHN